ncbi:hypothetical protein CEP54_003958, partial [Fusarium duplospermum]
YDRGTRHRVAEVSYATILGMDYQPSLKEQDGSRAGGNAPSWRRCMRQPSGHTTPEISTCAVEVGIFLFTISPSVARPLVMLEANCRPCLRNWSCLRRICVAPLQNRHGNHFSYNHAYHNGMHGGYAFINFAGALGWSKACLSVSRRACKIWAFFPKRPFGRLWGCRLARQKAAGGFTEAEPTLRGRHRTLTKTPPACPQAQVDTGAWGCVSLFLRCRLQARLEPRSYAAKGNR